MVKILCFCLGLASAAHAQDGNMVAGWVETAATPGLASPLSFSVEASQYGPELRVAHSGGGPWSLLSEPRVQVGPASLVHYSLRAMHDGLTAPLTSELVGFDKAGNELPQTYVRRSIDKGKGVFQVRKGVWRPGEGVDTVALRLSGRGPSNSWWQGVSLREKPVPEHLSPTAVFEEGGLRWEVDAGGWKLEAEGGPVWVQEGWGDGLEYLGVNTRSSRVLFKAPDGTEVFVILSIFGGGGKGPVKAMMTLDHGGSLRPGQRWPGLLRAPLGSRFVLPFNEGLLLARDAAEVGVSYDLDLSAGHFMSMRTAAMLKGEDGLLAIWWYQGADLGSGPLKRGEGLQFIPQAYGEKTDARLVLMPTRGGLAGLAQAQRSMIDARTLAQKVSANARVAQLAGAVNVHWFAKGATWQKQDDVVELAKSWRRAGFDRVLWSQASSPESVRAMHAQGWLAGRYENFQDLYPSDTPLDWVNKEGWPEQAMLRADGDWVRGWPHIQDGKTYYAGVRCSRPGLAYASVQLAKGNADRGYSAAFLDTTTANGLRECWHPDHPLIDGQELGERFKQLEKAEEQGLVTGSESGTIMALDKVHYFEGMLSPWPGRFAKAGYDLFTPWALEPQVERFILSPRERAPFFELAYHDTVVNYEYWGDAANRLPEHWRRKDLYSVLYGQPQLWVMDEERWAAQKAQAAKSYATWSPVVRHLFGQKMTDWKVLDDERNVQETHWEDGSVVRVDFLKDRFELKGPVKTKVFEARAK